MPQFNLRWPKSIDLVRKVAEENGRSVNSEIYKRVLDSLKRGDNGMKFIEVDEIGYENALGRGKSLVNVNGIESIRSGEFTEIRMMSGGIIPCRDSVESIKSKMSGQWLYSYSDLKIVKPQLLEQSGLRYQQIGLGNIDMKSIATAVSTINVPIPRRRALCCQSQRRTVYS